MTRPLGKTATKLIAGAAALVMMSGTAMAQSYRYMSCSELWYARNEIFAENGYCFQTARAIRAFGSDCFPPWGELSRAEQAEVDLIRSWEERKGC